MSSSLGTPPPRGTPVHECGESASEGGQLCVCWGSDIVMIVSYDDMMHSRGRSAFMLMKRTCVAASLQLLELACAHITVVLAVVVVEDRPQFLGRARL